MPDTAVEPLPVVDAPRKPDPEPNPDETPELAFADAAGAAQWVRTLPLSNVAQAYDVLLGQLRALTASGIGPRDRATIAELARDPVAHLHTELARRYAGKPQPLDEREAEAADQAIALWQALWVQYSVCLKPLLEGSTELKGVKAKLLQRALYVCKQLLVVHGLARRVPSPELWQELHAYYRLAEMLDCTTAAVSDQLMPDAEGLSCYSMYSHTLLLGLADPYAMSVRQIELTDRWLGQWSRKVFPYAKQRENEGPVIVVDLESTHGAVLVNTAAASQGPSVRFCYPAKLSTSVRGRLKRLAAGTAPDELELGGDVSSEAAMALLTRLDARWHQVPAGGHRKRSTAVEIAAGGIDAAYFRVSGRSFRRQDPLGRDTDPTKYLHFGFRPSQGRGGAQLALGKVVRGVRVARGVGQTPGGRRVPLVPRRARRRARGGADAARPRRAPCRGGGWSDRAVAAALGRRPEGLRRAPRESEQDRGSARRGAAPRGDARGILDARHVAAGVHGESRHALRRAGAGAQVQVDAHRPARRRFRARRVRARRSGVLAARPVGERRAPSGSDGQSRDAARGPWLGRGDNGRWPIDSRRRRAPTCASTPTTPSTGIRGVRKRSPAPEPRTGRSCYRSDIRRVIGAT
jgi:hypothetical protein